MNIGTLKRFAKGQFGFLEVEGQPDIFVHSNQFAIAGIVPEMGERYQFITQRGVDGRLRARSLGTAPAG